MKRKSFTYTTKSKYTVADEFKKGDVSIRSLNKQYNVDRKTIRRWNNLDTKDIPYK